MRPFFNEWNEYPLDLLEIPISKICNVLKKPTLIHLSGKREPAFFAALLLHGNEHTGFFALQKLLKKYENKTLPRSFSFFIGNVEAAPKNLRFLPHQRDYNRIWSPESPDGPET